MNFTQTYRSLVDHLPGYVVITDHDLVYQGCNQAGAKLWGLQDPRDIIGRTPYDMPAEIAEIAHVLREEDQQALAGNTLQFLETYYYPRDISKTLIVNKAPLITDNAVHGVLIQLLDVPSHRAPLKTLTRNKINAGSSSQQLAIQRTYHQVGLSKRESECVYLLLRGCSSKEIANKLGLRPRTVDSYIDNAKIKLNVDTRMQLTSYIRDNNLDQIIIEIRRTDTR